MVFVCLFILFANKLKEESSQRAFRERQLLPKSFNASGVDSQVYFFHVLQFIATAGRSYLPFFYCLVTRRSRMPLQAWKRSQNYEPRTMGSIKVIRGVTAAEVSYTGFSPSCSHICLHCSFYTAFISVVPVMKHLFQKQWRDCFRSYWTVTCHLQPIMSFLFPPFNLHSSPLKLL